MATASNPQRRFQFVLLPHLQMGDVQKVDIGEITIWNTSNLPEDFFPTDELKNRLHEILKRHRIGRQKHLLTGAGIVQYQERNFRHFSAQEMEKVANARNILFLSYISKNNLGAARDVSAWRMGTAENFQITQQNTDLDNPYIGESSGLIVKIQVGGYRIDEVIFQAPPYLPTPSSFLLDSRLIVKLVRLSKRLPANFRRVMRATEFVMQSYQNSPDVRQHERILSLAASFEIICSLPNPARKHFTDYIDQFVALPWERKYSYQFEAHRHSRATLKGIWGNRFFALRNQIIHGDAVPQSHFFFHHEHHLNIGILFFILILKKQLNGHFPRDPFFDQAFPRPLANAKSTSNAFKYFSYEIERVCGYALSDIQNMAWARSFT